jgi:alpha-tubulin suppressor-like RCC1 family protein
MRRSGRAALAAALFLAALATLAAAPEETSAVGSARWQQREVVHKTESERLKSHSADSDVGFPDTTNASSSSTARRALSQTVVPKPVAMPPVPRLAREDADVIRGILFSLDGALDAATDPLGDVARRRLRAVLVAPLVCGDAAAGSTCGSLHQVTPDGEKGAEVVMTRCAADSDVESACAVTDPLRRVFFFPEFGGRDPNGPNGPAYASLSYVVVDVAPDGPDSPYASSPDPADAKRSRVGIVAVRVNGKPVVPEVSRRVFVNSTFRGTLPLPFLATDPDGDAVTIEITRPLPGHDRVMGTNPGRGAFESRSESSDAREFAEWRVVDRDGTPGAALLSGNTKNALLPGSTRVWFAPRGVGKSAGCCPSRACGGATVPATCRACADDSANETSNDCLCCPDRHFYGSLRYVALDALGSRSNAEGTIEVYVRPGSEPPETPSTGTLGSGQGSGSISFAPPRVFASEAETAYFRVAARNFGEKTCVEYPMVQTADPYVACFPEPLRAILLNPPPVDGSKGALRAVVFPEPTSAARTLFSAFAEESGGGGGGDDAAAWLLDRFDRDVAVLLDATGTASEMTDARFHALVSEAVRLGVATVEPLGSTDALSGMFPAAWTNEFGGSSIYDVSSARTLPFESRLILAYTPPEIAAGFPFVTFSYGILDAAQNFSPTSSTFSVFVRHTLDVSVSRFTRFPRWAFRPVSESQRGGANVEPAVNWWSNGTTGTDPSDFPEELRGSHFLVPKRLDGMGAFAYPFGRNDVGQLGSGNARPRRVPILADDGGHRGLDLDRLAVGSRSAIGISNADGKAYAWGDGAGGRLGTGDAFPRTSPTAIGGLGDAVVSRVAAGEGHAAAVTAEGQLWTWGTNDHGQLGRSRRAGRLRGPAAVAVDPIAADAAAPFAPRRVTAGGAAGVVFVSVAVGDGHTVALDANGTMWTFGSNAGGQLGRMECLVPNLEDEAAGCETWGSPSYGALETPGALGLVLKERKDRPGPETTGSRLRDVDLSAGVKFRAIAANARYAVAISADPPPGSSEAQVVSELQNLGRPPDPAFPGSASASTQEAFDSAAVALGGRAYTFGWGDVGQLGHGVGFSPNVPDSYRASVPTPIAALEGVYIEQVSAGPTHVAAVDRAGRVYTWGSGAYGQLGHGDRLPSFVPRRVKALAGVNITSVAAGARHTVAVDDMGEVYAWGSNEFGELGLDPPPPLDPEKGPPYLTLRGWTQEDLHSNASGNRRATARRRQLLRIDAENDPVKAFDSNFERFRDASDPAGDFARSRATFRALLAGSEAPETPPPPWSDAYAFAKVASSAFDAEALSSRAYLWGWVVGQGAESAGRVESVALPQLVRGLAQVSEAAAGDGFTVAIRRACRPGTRLDRTSGACAACAPGTFSDELASEVCRACPRGSAAPAPGASACRACAPGSAAASEGSASCAPCDEGTFLGFGGGSSRAQCAPCAPGTRAGARGATVCEACPPGTYQSEFGATVCEACEAGRYAPSFKTSSAEECLLCPSGFFSNETGAATCEPCPPGFVTPEPGQTRCSGCPLGTYAETAGSVKCVGCPAGTYGFAPNASSVDAGCAPCPAGGFSKPLGATACEECPAGSFSAAPGSVECELCPPGFFGSVAGMSSQAAACTGCPPGRANPSWGAAAGFVEIGSSEKLGSTEIAGVLYERVGCTACAKGTYSSSSNATRCDPCPAGRFLDARGATTSEACALCAMGTFAPAPGTDACLPCPPGTFAEMEGSTTCAGCPPGTFNDAFGSSAAAACAPCPPGTFSDAPGTGNCTACPPGTFSAVSGSQKCEACPAGTFLAARNAKDASACVPCPAGTYGDAPGTEKCAACPPGTFSDVPGMGICTACPPGTSNPFLGGDTTAACVPCAIGAVAPRAGSGTCAPCAQGFYVSEEGQTECAACAPGTFSSSEGSSSIESCQPCPTSPFGTYAAVSGAARCARCPLGTYSDRAGAAQCAPTPPGTYLPSTGANSSAAALPCPKGTFAPIPGMAECSECRTGSYAATVGSVECTPCEAGFFLPLTRADDPEQCRPCGVGTRSPSGAGRCLPCPPGFYGDRPASAECAACPPGTFSPVAGASSRETCAACGKGYENPFEGRSMCLRCRKGTFGNLTGMSECWKCDPGTFVAEEGALFQTDCAPCAKGAYAPDPGSGTCAACPSGTFTEKEGSRSCAPCPARTYGSEQGADSVSRCDACPRWHFNSVPGSSSVRACVYAPFSGAAGAEAHAAWRVGLAVLIALAVRATAES